MLTSEEFLQQYGPWALVAGGSEGIGLAYAEQLAEKGMNIVLLCFNSDKLTTAQAAIRSKYSVDVRSVCVDLTAENCVEVIAPHTNDIDIGLLIYNAGAVRSADLFLDDPVAKSLAMIDLNCRGPVLLAHHFGKSMRERKRGGILIMSSMAGFAGGAYLSAYTASKGFEIIFAESMWHEMAQFNVDVLCVTAGLTRTPAMAESGLGFAIKKEGGGFVQEETEGGPQIMEPADVACEGLTHLSDGPVWIAGERNRESANMFVALPRAPLVDATSMGIAGMYGKPYVPVKSIPAN